MLTLRILACVLALVCLAAAPAAAQVGSGKYREADNRFELKAAAGWIKVPEALGSIRPASNSSSRITMAWCKSPERGHLVLPYVFSEVESAPFGSLRYADLEEAFSSTTKPETVLSQPLTRLVNQLPEDQWVLDRKRNRVIRRSKGEGSETIPDSTVLAVGMIGKDSTVYLVFESDTKLLQMYLPEFQQWVDTFSWDTGAAYTEPSASDKSKWNTGSSGGGQNASRNRRGSFTAEQEAEAKRLVKLVFGACGGGVLLVIVLVIVVAAKRR